MSFAHRTGTSSVESVSSIVWFDFIEDSICHTPGHFASRIPFGLEKLQQQFRGSGVNRVRRQSVVEIRAHINPRRELNRWFHRDVDLTEKVAFARALDRQRLHSRLFKKPIPNQVLGSKHVADLM